MLLRLSRRWMRGACWYQQYLSACLKVGYISEVNVNWISWKILYVTYVQKGVQLVTKVCYYLEFSYIYKHLIINKKALCLIAEGCTPGVDIINWASIIYAVLFSYGFHKPVNSISVPVLSHLRSWLLSLENMYIYMSKSKLKLTCHKLSPMAAH